MNLYKSIKSIATVIILFYAIGITAQVPVTSVHEKHCISDEERKLYNLITGYRAEHQLPSIELSNSLCFVARTHTVDLSENRPDFGGCNLHSWSDRGTWKPCCYAKDENRIACMNHKPRELTGYKAKAWEVVFSSDEQAIAEEAFNTWKEISLMNDYLLNSGKWNKPWQAIGVGIYGNYACVWFGEGQDPAGGAINCSDTLNRNAPVNLAGIEGLYYIIIANVSTKEQAESEVRKLITKGFKNAVYLPGTTFFRIAAGKSTNETDAYKELESIKKQFSDAWVLKPKK